MTANDGAHELADGAHTLAANLVVARDGSATLASGMSELADGIDTATDPLLKVLTSVEGSAWTRSRSATPPRIWDARSRAPPTGWPVWASTTCKPPRSSTRWQRP